MVKSVRSYHYQSRKDNTSRYDLQNISISIHADGFSLCVFDLKNHKILAIEEYQTSDNKNTYAELAIFLEDNEILTKPFQKIHLIINELRSTLIPSPLYNPEELKTIAAFNFQLNADESMMSEFILSLDAYQVFPVHNDLISIFQNQAQIAYHHGGSVLMDHYGKLEAEEKRIFAFAAKKQTEVLLFERQKLLFYNSFSTPAPEDAAYFIFSVYEQFQLIPTKHPLEIFSDQIELKNILSDYLVELKPIIVEPELFIGPEPQDMDRFFKPIKVHLCEL